MKSSTHGNGINEELININVGADASVRPEHKGNTQKGITLLALIITIIVLLILSVVSVRLITKNGIIEKTKFATLKHEIAQYDEELKLYTVAHRKEVTENPIYTQGYDNMKKYIPSFKKKYDDKLKIANNKLVYMNDTTTNDEKNTFENFGISSDAPSKITFINDAGKSETIEIIGGSITQNDLYKEKIKDKTKITQIEIGSSCTRINRYEFSECTGLNSLIVPTVDKIYWEWNTFDKCTGLTKVILGSNGHPVDSSKIDSNELSNCTQSNLVVDAYVSEDKSSWLLNFGASNAIINVYNEKTGELVNKRIGLVYKGNEQINWELLPDSDKITEIADGAFEGCTNLQLKSLPPKLKRIGGNTFKGCTKLQINQIPETCTFMGRYAFDNCINITEINIPNPNIYWEWNVFNNCKGISNVTIGEKNNPLTRNIGNPFAGCNNLTLKVFRAEGETSTFGAPWGASNATIEYYNAATGEMIN